jgi:hypothetical protein
LKASWQPYLAVILCGVGDFVTTYISLTCFGDHIMEGNANPNFFMMPLIICSFLLLFDVAKKLLTAKLFVRDDFFEVPKATLVLVALVPTINNLQLILKVIFGF